jgi:hypothetical protein
MKDIIMSNNTSIDSLLDMNLDDLADIPEFKVFPAGAYTCQINFEKKTIGTHPAIEAKLKMLSCVELADPAEVAPEVGTESSTAYMLDLEMGQGNFKKLMKPLQEHFQISRLPELLEASANAEVMVVTKIRQNKDKTQSYLDIVSLQVV